MSSNSYHPQYLTAAIERLHHARDYESATSDAHAEAAAEYRAVESAPTATIEDLEAAHSVLMCAHAAWAHAACVLVMRQDQWYAAHKRAEAEGYRNG